MLLNSGTGHNFLNGELARLSLLPPRALTGCRLRSHPSSYRTAGRREPQDWSLDLRHQRLRPRQCPDRHVGGFFPRQQRDSLVVAKLYRRRGKALKFAGRKG